MINFFTKLLTPIFIILGLVSSPGEIPKQIQPITQQQEVIRLKEKIQELEFKKTLNIEKENTRKKEKKIIKTEKKEYKPKKIEKKIEDVKKEIVPTVQSVIKKVIDVKEPICGNAKKARSYEKPTEDLCAEGEALAVTENKDTFTWQCGIQDVLVNCSSRKMVDGKCAYKEIIPTDFDFGEDEFLCKSGITIKLKSEKNGVKKWRCKNINDGISVACRAVVSSGGICSDYIDCEVGIVANISEGGGKVSWICKARGNGEDSFCSSTIRNY